MVNRHPLAEWLTMTIGLLLVLVSSSAMATGFEVVPDRMELSENETLTLYIRTDNISSRDEPDISSLQQDFEILSTQVRSNIQIVNGRNQSEKIWQVTLLPKRSGQLEIPPIRLGSEESQAIPLKVAEAPTDEQQSADVFLDSQIDQKGSIYVQQQLIYTLRLYYATTISDHGLTELDLPDTLMLQLGNRQDFESRINGKLYNVAQWQFAIFPQHSGELLIPAQTFSGRVRLRNNYSLGALQQIRTKSPEHRVQVKPIPESFPKGHTWIPAESLELQEQWGGDFSQWQSGTPLTRTLVLNSRGLTAAQLPPLDLTLPTSLRQYPEQPQLEDSPTAEGVLGTKQRSFALIPTQAGELILPGVSIPWWNTVTDQLEYARLAPLTLEVQADPAQTSPAPAIISSDQTAQDRIVYVEKDNMLWQAVAAVSVLINLLLLILWRKNARNTPEQSSDTEQKRSSDDPIRRELIQACQRNNVRQALQLWQQWPGGSEARKNPTIKEAVMQLEAALYSPSSSPEQWQGAALAQALNQTERAKKSGEKPVLEPLYPT